MRKRISYGLVLASGLPIYKSKGYNGSNSHPKAGLSWPLAYPYQSWWKGCGRWKGGSILAQLKISMYPARGRVWGYRGTSLIRKRNPLVGP